MESERAQTLFQRYSYSRPEVSKRFLHLKGYAYGISFDQLSAHVNTIINWIISYFEDQDGSDSEPCLAFDGDSFSRDSFTYIIPLLVERMPNIEIWAFLRHEKDLTRFQNSWRNSGVPSIHVHPFDNVISFEQLGVFALGYTQAQDVICFGGGECVLKEHRETRRQVKFQVVPIARVNRKTGGVERCTLDAHMPVVELLL